MTKKIWSTAFLLLLSFFIFVSWQKPRSTVLDKSNPTSTIEESPIVIGYSSSAGWWPWAIAESEGLFAKHGANVELKWYDNYTASLKDLAAGAIDGNCQTLSDTIAFAGDALKGEVAVLVNDNSAGNDKIIVDREINALKDLKNKQVALEAGVVEDFLLTLALEQEGMERSDVDIVDVETGAATEAFVAGLVDGVGAFAPFWLNALAREGSREIVSSKDFPGAIPDLLVVTEELVDKHHDIVQALTEIWFDILNFMATNQSRADEIMMNRAGVSPQEFELFREGTKMFDLEDNLEAFADGSSMKNMPYAVEKITSFLNDSLTPVNEELDPDKILNRSFVKKVQAKT